MKFKHALVEIKHAMQKGNKNLCKKETILYAMRWMDTYHDPHGAGSGFESGAGLSIPLVRLSSLGGVPDDDPFFRHTLLGAGFDSTPFFSDFRNFLHWILHLAFL